MVIMRQLSYLLWFSLVAALFSGCAPKAGSPTAVAAADRQPSDDDSPKNKEPVSEPDNPPPIVEMVPPVPVVLNTEPVFLPPFLGLPGTGGSGGRHHGRDSRVSLSVEKTASVESLVAGDVIIFTITVTNNGSADVSNIDVSEADFSGIGLTSPLICLPAKPARLAPNEQMVCTTTYTVQPGDVDALSLSNTVQVTGIGPGNKRVTKNDFIVLPSILDFGDAPNTYGTILSSDGARHSVPTYNSVTHLADLRLGATIDTENNGFPSLGANGDDIQNIDDENGLVDQSDAPISSINVVSGAATQISVLATNVTTSAATLAAWIDFNNNGTFDPSELQSVNVPANSGTQIYELTFPAATVSDASTFLRLRLFRGAIGAPSPTGPALGGEVEDYPVVLTTGLDFGDAPDTYGTLLTSNGARHEVLSYNSIAHTSTLSLGLLVDTESDGFPGVAATGDDLNNIDDEAGVTAPIVVVNGSSTNVGVIVTNTTASVATLVGWIDTDLNGTFDADEFVSAPVPANSGSDVYQLIFPATTLQDDTYARFRLFPGTVVAPVATGVASGGEVEDYTVLLGEDLDFSDAPDLYGTSLVSDGARHQPVSYDIANRSASLMIGSRLDTEPDGFPGVAATGDDLDDVDDEDGVSGPIIVVISATVPTIVTVSVTNNTGSVATLAGWIDWNINGVFDTAERGTVAIPANSGTANYNISIPAVGPNTQPGISYARFRLFSGVVAAPSPTGLAASGEVEDYTAFIGSVGL